MKYALFVADIFVFKFKGLSFLERAAIFVEGRVKVFIL